MCAVQSTPEASPVAENLARIGHVGMSDPRKAVFFFFNVCFVPGGSRGRRDAQCSDTE